jgi:nickel-dependent lactate racemase
VKLRLDYGTDGLDAEFPDDARVLDMADVPGLDEIDDRIAAALRRPIGTPALAQLAQGRRSACVVISDITRPVPNALILPPILQTLEEAGIARDDITILVGTGLHRPNEGEELVRLVGAEIASTYRIVNHKARERDTLVHLGETSGGAPIWIDRIYVEADLKIATSLIEPHLMAGYSGGRKAICPGIMGVDTMKVLHGPQLMGDPRSAEGIIEGNPFHRQALEVAQKAGVDFTFNVAMNDRREVTGIFAGDLEKAHAEGVRFVEEHAAAYVDEPLPIVVTTSAGYPLDLTFYQAVKGLTAVLPIVQEGGTILLAARCSEGLGSPEFTELLADTDSAADFEQRLRDPAFFVIDQWQLQELCKVLRKARVLLVSESIPADGPHMAGLVTVVPDIETGLAEARRKHGAQAPMAVIPRGPYVLARSRAAGQGVSA